MLILLPVCFIKKYVERRMTNKKPGDFYGKPINKPPGNRCGICWAKVVSKPENRVSVWIESPNLAPVRLGYVCKDCRFKFGDNDNDFSSGAVN